VAAGAPPRLGLARQRNCSSAAELRARGLASWQAKTVGLPAREFLYFFRRRTDALRCRLGLDRAN
jgi:hypothetical protein